MKKYVFLLVSLILFSCTTQDDNISNIESSNQIVSKTTSQVSLVKAWTAYGNYRGFTAYSKKFTVRVANLNVDKTVSIFQKKIDGSWGEIPLTYQFNIDDQNEIWAGEVNNEGFGISQIYDDEFVVKYEVNGNTYWDNNNAANYAMSIQDGYFFAQPDLNVSVDTDFSSISYVPFYDQNSINITVDVRNLAPQKEVGVIYTTDGWKTQDYFSLSYRSFWNNGPLFLVQSPNDFGVERWSGNVRVDKTANTIEYAVVYKVNGQEYWDNNYDKNYTITRRFYN
ncbi:carbohydrate-binding protein [Aquimarina sp. AU474]|uniref:carbohydrate-binding protein n=1 Tax=Aquimarina sp. AU474 TaxID=2108529 RepID=UPI000D699D3F|nr:carbohydrate-binding protein [Aquimarina sp. AU474]